MNELLRIGLQQRMLPSYRAPFFEALASEFQGRLSVFAGLPREKEAVATAVTLQKAHKVDAVNHHFFDKRFYLCWQSGFTGWLQSWQPDVLIVEANPRYLSTPAALRWMKQQDRPVIAWGLGAPAALKDIDSPVASLQRSWQKRFFDRFDAIIAYSRQGAAEYAALGFDAGRIFVANNAVAPRPAHDCPQRPADFTAGKPVILFVGRLQARKRVDCLLSACHDLPEESRPHLWIVGDGPARAGLEEMAVNIYPSARFFGMQQGAELEEIFKQADLFVLPGTGGLAVQQAMSFGLPVIVAEADGTQSDLVRPANGWLVPPGDRSALQRTIEQALADIAALRRKGQASYHIVSEEINLENMVNVFKQAIYTVLEK